MDNVTPSPLTIGIVHPGEMGAGMGAALRRAGQRVVWASEGRSASTRARADAAGLEDVGTLDSLVEVGDIVLSVVPPAAALDLAGEVGARARHYIDANAVSPAESLRMRSVVEAGGASFTDGAVVGLPPTEDRGVRLFVSDDVPAALVEACAGSVIDLVVLQGSAAPSALKMCYAAWTKGTQALLLASQSAARFHGVEAALEEEWGRSQPHLPDLALDAGVAAARKGWRWVNEMLQISSTFAEAGLPAGFHEAAATVFGAPTRDEQASRSSQTLDEVLDALTSETRRS